MANVEGKMDDMETDELGTELDKAIDDPEEWGTPQRSARTRKSEKRQRVAVVSVRLTEAELELIQQFAANAGVSVGAYMRDTALKVERQTVVLSTYSSRRMLGVPNSSAGISAGHDPLESYRTPVYPVYSVAR